MTIGQPISVNFSIYLEQDEIIEFEFVKNFEHYYMNSKLESFSGLYGNVSIHCENESFIVSDELGFIINGLLFGSITSRDWQQEGCYGYRYTSQATHLAMLYSRDRVIMFGDHEPYTYTSTVFFDADPLYLAFYQCGRRYVDFIKRLGDAGLVSIEYVSIWEQREGQARKTLEARGFL